jgi:hypothetical protein
MVYSGISISVATHAQKQVASKKPMKNSRVISLRIATLDWKEPVSIYGLMVDTAIMAGQGLDDFFSNTLLHTQIVGSDGATVDVHMLNMSQYFSNVLHD